MYLFVNSNNPINTYSKFQTYIYVKKVYYRKFKKIVTFDNNDFFKNN